MGKFAKSVLTKFLALLVFCLAITLTAMSARKGPEIRIVDDRVSMQAESVPLSRLLQLFDQATGIVSKVPDALADRNISVRFNNLNLDDAVQKIFEGQSLDYVYLEGKSIIVTGHSQVKTQGSERPASTPAQPAIATEGNPPSSPPVTPPPAAPQAPTVADANAKPPATPQAPAAATQPWSPNPPGQPQQSVPSTPTPGQMTNQNPFSSTLPGFSSPSPWPGAAATQPANH